MDAININTQDQLDRILLGKSVNSSQEMDEPKSIPLPEENECVLLVFHCEHSLHRAPRL